MRQADILGAAGATAVVLSLFLIPVVSLRAASGADWDAGSDAFDTYCSDCHSVSPKGTNRKGPTIYRVMGRRAGTVPGFQYSQGMARSGIVWTPQTLNTYLANPRGMIPDGKMKKGLATPDDRANVIAFLARPE